jgi:hypothetical protein
MPNGVPAAHLVAGDGGQMPILDRPHARVGPIFLAIFVAASRHIAYALLELPQGLKAPATGRVFSRMIDLTK